MSFYRTRIPPDLNCMENFEHWRALRSSTDHDNPGINHHESDDILTTLYPVTRFGNYEIDRLLWISREFLMPRFTHENLSRPIWGRLFLGPTVEVDYDTAVEKSFIRQLVGEFAFLVKLRVHHDILPTNSFVLVNLIVLPKRELYKVEFLRGDLWAIGKVVNDYEAQEILKQLAFVNYHSLINTMNDCQEEEPTNHKK